MDEKLHAILVKFRIIACIEVGQKLDTKSNELTIQHVNLLSPIYRKFSNDSRECTISYLEALVLNFASVADGLIEKNEYPKIVDSVEAFQGMINGISNLAKTYKDDKTTGQKLKSIVKDYILPMYKKLIYHLPAEMLSAQIKSGVTFIGETLFTFGQKTPENSASSTPADSPQSPERQIPEMTCPEFRLKD